MQPHSATAEKFGLSYWMDRVLEEYSKAGEALPAKPIHDLRTSLRRCILIAEIMKDIDSGRDWKAMQKSARRTFQRFGKLRDAQVLAEWVEKLGARGEASTDSLLKELEKAHAQAATDARTAIREFDLKQWRAWGREFAKQYGHVASNRAACESLILEIWQSVYELNRRAQRSRSLLAYHRLRMELKKFRYAVENFLPPMYSGWASELKVLQDLLGEIHDLTVLDQTIVKNRGIFEQDAFAAWRKKVEEERSSRLRQYRAKMAGKSSPLRTWREGLPAEKDVRATGLARLGEWASFATPDIPRVRRIARLSLQLYDGLANSGLIGKESRIEERFILHALSLIHI